MNKILKVTRNLLVLLVIIMVAISLSLIQQKVFLATAVTLLGGAACFSVLALLVGLLVETNKK